VKNGSLTQRFLGQPTT